MRKRIIATILLICILVCFCMSGCFGFFVDTDQKIAKENTDKLIDAICNNDKEKIVSLMSSNAISNLDTFDNMVQDLIDYHDGEYVSRDYFNVHTSEIIKNGKYEITHNISCDFSTTVTKYRINVVWKVKDEVNFGNEGISSLYLIKYEDDLGQGSAYWGDGVTGTGIYVGKVHVLDYFNLLTKSIYENKSASEVKSLFALNKTQNIENFDSNVNSLLLYMDGTYLFENWSKPTGVYSRDKTIYLMQFDLVTEEKKYCIAIKWCTEDKENENNVGIWSLYVNEFVGTDEEFFSDHTYIGDGLWTDGINIGIPNAQ